MPKSKLSTSKTPKLINAIDLQTTTVRRSPRFPQPETLEKPAAFTTPVKPSSLRRSSRLSCQASGKTPSSKPEYDMLNKSEKEETSEVGVQVVLGMRRLRGTDFFVGSEVTQVTPKIKSGKRVVDEEDGDDGKDDNGRSGVKSGGWTKEQEKALQRAFFATKPTPHFWKKVSKLVPGKSAQQCFDKVNADHITPPPQPPRTRVKRSNSSKIEASPLSASKLLYLSGHEIQKLKGTQKTYRAQKKVRQLLQKQNNQDQHYQADLFSILEPKANVAAQDSSSDAIFATPSYLDFKSGSLKKCHGSRSSGRKVSPILFSGLRRMEIASPPVLKEVKNKVLHEKYIDRLHVREAKRKAESLRARKSSAGKENKRHILVPKADVVKAAKTALVCGAKDAIDQFKHLQAIENSSDTEEYVADIIDEDEEGEY